MLSWKKIATCSLSPKSYLFLDRVLETRKLLLATIYDLRELRAAKHAAIYKSKSLATSAGLVTAP